MMYYPLGTTNVLAALLGVASASPHLRQQRDTTHYGPPPPRYVANATRANAVKQTFQISWDGYYKYAFPHDSLLPVTNGWSDDRNGWGASAVDAFSTALVMQNWPVVNEILKFVPTINFDNTTTDISLFETTIRYLGGLLSAYDLMTGPLLGTLNDTADDIPSVLAQAKRLADNLKVAFDTPTGIPDNGVRFGPPRRDGSTTNGLATIGTLVLEWTRLSDLTGDPTYGLLAQKGESYLLRPEPQPLAEPFPGLLGTNVNISNGMFLDGSGGWGGGDDSFYEYLIKMFLYDPVRFAGYKDRWVEAADSSIEFLASHPTTRPDLTFLAMWDNTTLQFVSEHLACFNGGNFILGGLTLNEPKYTQFGLDLVDACHETYVQTATGIGPEVFQWQDDKEPATNSSNNPPPPAGADATFYERAGFWITNGNYVLRPEVLESIYYAYRATGDTKYQDWAWDAYLAINTTTAVGSGYSSINDVNQPGGGGFANFQESFWFAEVLKYSYLIQSEDAAWQVKADHTNQFVFNTECHPIRLASGFERPGYE
ncbi:glycoside hydrolase [Diplogelasinospora grovesii]|uniref:alpha-1,2-Mannosidase n=1 Tax=Diplogelasinospora grovesii TaxID=303347 RepID=A0AAN6NC96_9PEZI|nr:glycoside hydrolase [Diplogelasinospora grovesii]